MTPTFRVFEQHDQGTHHLRAYEPGSSTWLAKIADTFVALRTASALPLTSVSLDGIDFDVSAIERFLRQATVPKNTKGGKQPAHLRVARSDFGEVIAYMLLAEGYSTAFGYKSVRDRELIQLPGRGIDAVGIEETDTLIRIILGEVKVSDAADSPPGVVNNGNDCLEKQHDHHLRDLKATATKLFDLGRKATDIPVRDALLSAAIAFTTGRTTSFQIVTTSVLVRPRLRYTTNDFGDFANNPNRYSPAEVRFLIFCVPADIESTIDDWYVEVDRLCEAETAI